MKKFFIALTSIVIILRICLAEANETGGGNHDKIAFEITKLSEKLEAKSLDELRQTALNMEEFFHKKIGLILGGLHDYLNSMTKDDLIKYCLKAALNNPELLSEETFSSEIESKSKNLIFLENEKAEMKIGGLYDYIWKQNRETLERWALTVETYDRSHLSKPLIGGLHDYIKSMSIEDLTKYTLKMANKYPILNSASELDRLSIEYGFLKPEEHQEDKIEYLGGLHDYIFRKDRESLVKWALTCEAHERRNLSKPLYGGLHDYIFSMSNEDIAKYILEKAKVYPELDSEEKLNTLSAIYGINQSSDHISALKSILLSKDKSTLIKYALTCEAYERKAQHLHLLGGLHDYVHKLSNEMICEYIIKMATMYPDLDSVEKLEKQSESFGIKVPSENHNLSYLEDVAIEGVEESRQVNRDMLLGGLHDYIRNEPRETLINWALAIEKYEVEEIKKIKIEGGIGENIFKLPNSEIISYILKKAYQHKELNSREFLESLCKKYGLTHN